MYREIVKPDIKWSAMVDFEETLQENNELWALDGLFFHEVLDYLTLTVDCCDYCNALEACNSFIDSNLLAVGHPSLGFGLCS